MLTIGHLSDTHVGGHDRAIDRLRAVLDHLGAMSPQVDVLLLTGDITDHGTEQEYVVARAELGRWPGPAPLLMCPGNHDVREPYARVLRGWPEAADPELRCDEVHDVGQARFVMLDSLVSAVGGVRIDHGHLAASSLAVLEDALAAGRPTYVCLHHPPAELHLQLMDPIRLDNAAELAEVIRRHDNVVAILVGHAHTMAATTFAGVPLLVGGGVASTVTVDAEDLPPITTELPATFAMHLVGDDGRPVTHWRALPQQ